jgi:hypothetical protein
METNLESIKRRIKKLLALSASPNENEAAAALEKAQALMEEYHLTEGECLYIRHSVPATKRLSRWRTVLSNAVSWLYCCETFRNSAQGEICFFGESFDAFMAGEMYRYLSKTVERMAKQNIRKPAKMPCREKYKLGTAGRLSERIRKAGKEVSRAPEREHRLLAAKKTLANQVTLVTKKLKLTGAGKRTVMVSPLTARQPDTADGMWRRGTEEHPALCIGQDFRRWGRRWPSCSLAAAWPCSPTGRIPKER